MRSARPRAQAASGRFAQRAIERAQVARQRVPHRLLEDEQAAADFLHRRRPPQPDVFRAQTARISGAVVLDVEPLVDRQVLAVPPLQRLRDPHLLRRQAPGVIAVGCAVRTISTRIETTAS